MIVFASQMLPLNNQISVGWILITAVLIIIFINLIKMVVYFFLACKNYSSEKSKPEMFYPNQPRYGRTPIVPLGLSDNSMQQFYPEVQNVDTSYMDNNSPNLLMGSRILDQGSPKRIRPQQIQMTRIRDEDFDSQMGFDQNMPRGNFNNKKIQDYDNNSEIYDYNYNPQNPQRNRQRDIRDDVSDNMTDYSRGSRTGSQQMPSRMKKY